MISFICGIQKTKQMNKQQNNYRVIDAENKSVFDKGKGKKIDRKRKEIGEGD